MNYFSILAEITCYQLATVCNRGLSSWCFNYFWNNITSIILYFQIISVANLGYPLSPCSPSLHRSRASLQKDPTFFISPPTTSSKSSLVFPLVSRRWHYTSLHPVVVFLLPNSQTILSVFLITHHRFLTFLGKLKYSSLNTSDHKPISHELIISWPPFKFSNFRWEFRPVS